MIKSLIVSMQQELMRYCLVYIVFPSSLSRSHHFRDGGDDIHFRLFHLAIFNCLVILYAENFNT